MSKSVLVIETPRECIDCPCHVFTNDSNQNVAINCRVNGNLYKGKSKPNWCPLTDLPKKITKATIYKYDRLNRAYCGGYNDVIDMIEEKTYLELSMDEINIIRTFVAYAKEIDYVVKQAEPVPHIRFYKGDTYDSWVLKEGIMFNDLIENKKYLVSELLP